jgi:hypothetical protein
MSLDYILVLLRFKINHRIPHVQIKLALEKMVLRNRFCFKTLKSSSGKQILKFRD